MWTNLPRRQFIENRFLHVFDPLFILSFLNEGTKRNPSSNSGHAGEVAENLRFPESVILLQTTP
jgi:hypothetical protein